MAEILDADMVRQREAARRAEFPRFLMKSQEGMRYAPLHEAGPLMDCGFHLLGFVLEANFTVRDITEQEREYIGDAADRHSEEK